MIECLAWFFVGLVVYAVALTRGSHGAQQWAEGTLQAALQSRWSPTAHQALVCIAGNQTREQMRSALEALSDQPTPGGEHSRPSRPRAKAVNAAPKHRWWAPWSRRAAEETD